MQSPDKKAIRRVGFAAAAVSAFLVVGPCYGSAEDPAPAAVAVAAQTAPGSPANPATLEPAQAQGEGDKAVATKSSDRSPLTPEGIRAAIAEAEKRRLAKTQPNPDLPKALREQWGVEVIGINLTSAGYMLDFRFRVVDVEKALPLFDHRIKPYVVAEKSEIKLPVPMAAKVGAFRPTNRGKNIKADKTYYMVFGNPDSYVKAGEKVSVVIGDFRAEKLTVQ